MRSLACLSFVALVGLLLACGGTATPLKPGEVKGPDTSAPPPSKEPPPTDLVKRSVKVGAIVVRLLATRVGKVELTNLGQPSQSEKDLFQVALEIRNTHATRKLDYEGWGTEGPWLAESAGMTDEHGNTYKRITFGFATQITGQVRQEAIYPGKSVTDLLVFEAPVDAARQFTLKLPVPNLGGKGYVRVLLPREFTRK